MTKDQKDILKTIHEHGSIAALSYRLTFTPEEQKWAKEEGYVERVRSTYRLTGAGRLALSLSRPSQNSEAK
jgi:hypothetical protein